MAFPNMTQVLSCCACRGDLVPSAALKARSAIANGTELTFAYGATAQCVCYRSELYSSTAIRAAPPLTMSGVFSQGLHRRLARRSVIAKHRLV